MPPEMFPHSLVKRVMDVAPIARLAQIDDLGEAQVLPFVFVRTANALWSPVDGKPKRHARLTRLDWVAHHPNVCVLIDHYCETWSELWWLKLYCHAAIFRGDHPQWKHASAALVDKYPQYADIPLFSGEPTMIRFQWREWKSWSAGGEKSVEAWLEDENTASRRQNC